MANTLARGVTIEKSEFKKNVLAFTTEKPIKEKSAVLSYMKRFAPAYVSAILCKDPITDRVFAQELDIYIHDEYQWNNAVIYLFEKYNLRLADDFIEHCVSNVA